MNNKLYKILEMKKLSILLLLLFSIIACDKTSERSSQREPFRDFIIVFEITDTLGNNILPDPLPESPYLQPENFYATTNLKEGNIGSYGIIQGEGYVLKMSATYYDITENPVWQQDSIFQFYPVIGTHIDTVTIYKTSFLVTDPADFSFANLIVWNQDTLGEYQGELLSIQK